MPREPAPRMKDASAKGEGMDYWFPVPPAKGAFEWEGPPVGSRNVITEKKGRVAGKDKTLHRQPEKYQRIRGLAQKFIEDHRGVIMIRDAVIHGVRVRMFTNSEHHCDFWIHNWFSPEEWEQATGRTTAGRPRVIVYALTGIEGEQPAAYYNRNASEVIFFNTSYYGQLKSWTLGAVGRVLAEEYGIHSIHGACVVFNGKAILYIAPTGTGKSTSSYGLTPYPGTKFHSDDWVYVRHAYRNKRDGKFYAPFVIRTGEGSEVKGFRVFRWIKETGSQHPDANVEALMLNGDEVSLRLNDLDISAPPTSFGYISEKEFYLRTNLVESFPLALVELMRCETENCPQVTDAFLSRMSATLDGIVSELLSSTDLELKAVIKDKGWAELRKKIARFIAFGNSRAMFDQSRAFEKGKVILDPMEPVTIDTVMLIKRDLKEKHLLESLALGEFIERLLIGDTPDGKWEIAYNDYRAVDDEEEKKYLRELFERAGGAGRTVYQQFVMDRTNRPSTLDEEFELMEVLHGSTRCYDLNTILQAAGYTKRDSVAKTIQLIVKVLRDRPTDIRVTLEELRGIP
jgi:hypothetical protein